MQTKEEWTALNSRHFVGLVKLINKIPVTFETKANNWLWKSDAERDARVLDVVKFSNESPANGIGVLFNDSILIVDCDSKPNKPCGIKRWEEYGTGIDFTMSSSGSGKHIYVNNPLSGGINSNMKSATIDGTDAGVSVELFSGHSQLLALSTREFDWSTLDLDALPNLPTGLLDGVQVRGEYASSNVQAVKSLNMELPHGKNAIANLFLIAKGVTGLDRYDNYYKFTVALHNLSYYQASARGNDELASKIKSLWMFVACNYDYYKKSDWNKQTYRGEEGLSLRYLGRGNKYSRGIKANLGSERMNLRAEYSAFLNSLK